MKKTRTNPKTRDKEMVINGEVVAEEKKTKKSKPKTTAIAKRENIDPTIKDQSVEAMITRAIDKGTPVETMERLLAMRRELKQEWAKEQFDKAMAGFQSECPIIIKSKAVLNSEKKGGGLRYKYAPLDAIVTTVKPFLLKYGLSYTVNAKSESNMITAIIKITHQAGHSESSEFQIPIDPEAFMNQQQKFASALTFAKRYAFCNGLGILTGDEDDDGTAAKDDDNKKDTTNYLDKLKAALIHKGAKNVSDAIRIFNDISGYNLKEFPKQNNQEVKDLYDVFISSPKAL